MALDKPTLTGDLRKGDEVQALRQLQSAGVGVEDFAAIGKDPRVCVEVAEILIKHRLFASPNEQVARLLEINERVWQDPAITKEKILEDLRHEARLPRQFSHGERNWWSPEWPVSHKDALFAVTLFWETGDPLLTLFRNMQAYLSINEAGLGLSFFDMALRCGGSTISVEELRKWITISPNARVRPVGARWETVELGRAFDHSTDLQLGFASVRNKTKNLIMQVGQELPALAVMHPGWARAIDWEEIFPSVLAPELVLRAEVKHEGEEIYTEDWSVGLFNSHAGFPKMEIYRDRIGGGVGIGWFLP